MAKDETSRAFSAAVGSGSGATDDVFSGSMAQLHGGFADYTRDPKTGRYPMHFINDNGVLRPTTIMNPRRSDPAVEAVLGEAKYKVKPRPESASAQNLRIAELENQLKAMMAIMAGQMKQPEDEPVKEADERTYREIQAEAKSLGIKANQPQEALIEAIAAAKEQTPVGDF